MPQGRKGDILPFRRIKCPDCGLVKIDVGIDDCRYCGGDPFIDRGAAGVLDAQVLVTCKFTRRSLFGRIIPCKYRLTGTRRTVLKGKECPEHGIIHAAIQPMGIYRSRADGTAVYVGEAEQR